MIRKNKESIRFLSPADMPYIHAVYGVNVTNEFARHAHHKFCIGVVEQGTRKISLAGASEIIPENAMFVINPGISHTCGSLCKEGNGYAIICVDVGKMEDITCQISEKAQTVPHIDKLLPPETELVSKTRRFFSLLEDEDSTLLRESLLISILSMLIVRHAESPPRVRKVDAQHGAINRAREFISAHFDERLTLEDLSRAAGLSPFHFQRLFLKHTGMAPHDYLIRCRVKNAGRLLLEGRGIARVAVDTGFVDQSHFTRVFKRIIGITPGTYFRLHK
jgi:AraC-like DNA-binding protein